METIEVSVLAIILIAWVLGIAMIKIACDRDWI